MTPAPFRITLWRTKKPISRLARFVSGVDRKGAVFCALQWIQWTHATGRGKRPRFERYSVEERGADNVWMVVEEGTYKDAKENAPEGDFTFSEERTVQVPGFNRSKASGIVGEPKRRKGTREPSRLAQLVAEMKARK